MLNYKAQAFQLKNAFYHYYIVMKGLSFQLAQRFHVFIV